MDPPQHRFYDLWEDFVQKMDSIREDHCRGLLNCFITILLHNRNWKNGLTYIEGVRSRQQMAKLIRSTTPNILILDVQIVDFRHPPNSGTFIIIPKYWADHWDRVMAFDPDCQLALVLEAILKVMLVHQLAHWLSAPEGSDTLLEDFLHSLNLEDNANTIRGREEIEPGDYVEWIAGGGMAHFEGTRDDIYFPARGSDENYLSPPTNFFFSIRENGYAFFTPSTRVIDVEWSAH